MELNEQSSLSIIILTFDTLMSVQPSNVSMCVCERERKREREIEERECVFVLVCIKVRCQNK